MTKYSTEFKNDLLNQLDKGSHDPRNFIGPKCGFGADLIMVIVRHYGKVNNA